MRATQKSDVNTAYKKAAQERHLLTKHALKTDLPQISFPTRLPTPSVEVETFLPELFAQLLSPQSQLSAVSEEDRQHSLAQFDLTPDHQLYITVMDHGVGFDVEAALRAQTSGLTGMVERATLLGGQLRVESKPGQGTRILAYLSISDADCEEFEDADHPLGG